jgi:hypothetical protein
VVALLIANEFILANPKGYNLATKSGSLLVAEQAIAKAGIKNGDTLRIIPSADAGGGIPGLDSRSITDFPLAELRRSLPALTMFVRLHQDLEHRHLCLSAELEAERFKSNSRLIASLLLLIGQVVISVGASVLTTDRIIGVVVIAAGALQAVLATFLTFRRPPRPMGTKPR